MAKIKVTNHRASSVHLHVGDGEKLELKPGVNLVEEAAWDAVKDHEFTQALGADGVLELGVAQPKGTIPTLREFMADGENPADYKKRFPSAKVEPEEMKKAVEDYEAKLAEEKRARAGRTGEKTEKKDKE